MQQKQLALDQQKFATKVKEFRKQRSMFTHQREQQVQQGQQMRTVVTGVTYAQIYLNLI